MLYDPAAYTLDYSDEDKRRVLATSEHVVTGLNDLQMINAFENIFYCNSGQEKKFNTAQERLDKYIEEESTVFRTLESEEHDLDTALIPTSNNPSSDKTDELSRVRILN